MMVEEEACGNVKYSNLSHIIGRQLEVEYVDILSYMLYMC